MQITTSYKAAGDACLAQNANTQNVFGFNKKTVVINFCDSDENVLQQSEITKEDAIKLAKLILHIYK